MDFQIKLPLFKGPFDLLLFFIERDELDIYDIPISRITNDFLSYIKKLEEMNVEVASEFILVAATLMKIKSKLLVPRPEIDDNGKEIDPRKELVERLLEYKKYKSVVEELANLEEKRKSRNRRGNAYREVKKLAAINNVESEIQDIDLYKVLKVYQKVLKRFQIEQSKPIHQVIKYPYTVSNQKKHILEKFIAGSSKISFLDIILENREKIAVVFNFLAVLELLQLKAIKLTVGEGFNNFWIEQI